MGKRCAFTYINKLVGEAMIKLDDHDIREDVLNANCGYKANSFW